MNKTEIKELIKLKAKAHNVPYQLVEAMVKVESNFDPNVDGDGGSSWGLGQISGPVREWYCQAVDPSVSPHKKEDWHNPEINIDCTCWYIRTRIDWLRDHHKPVNPDTIITAYNAGVGRVGNPPKITKSYIKIVKSYLGKNYPFFLFPTLTVGLAICGFLWWKSKKWKRF